MSNIIYPGSFCPLSSGHCDIIERALSLPFDNLIIAILDNPNKTNQLFTMEERWKMIDETFNSPRIQVIMSTQALVHVADEYNCTHILRGIRGVTDLPVEMEIAHTNLELSDGRLETIFLATSLKNTFISSSNIRERWKLGFDVKHLVPPVVGRELERKRNQLW